MIPLPRRVVCAAFSLRSIVFVLGVVHPVKGDRSEHCDRMFSAGNLHCSKTIQCGTGPQFFVRKTESANLFGVFFSVEERLAF